MFEEKNQLPSWWTFISSKWSSKLKCDKVSQRTDSTQKKIVGKTRILNVGPSFSGEIYPIMTKMEKVVDRGIFIIKKLEQCSDCKIEED